MLLRVAVASPRLPSRDWILAALAPHAAVETVPRGTNVAAWLRTHAPDAFVVDSELFDAAAGPEGGVRPPPHAIVLCDAGELGGSEGQRLRERLAASGAAAVLARDGDPRAMVTALRAALDEQRERLLRERSLLPAVESRLADFSTRSAAMAQVLRIARRVVDTDTSLLVTGETGTGKEYLVQAIHMEGRRRAGPFVAVNCAAFAESLIESELFGHAAGAFTGARTRRRGAFELAHRGTLFLDEIGEMPLHLQPKLLRALQERRIQPVGDEREIEVDVRVVAATNRDLASEVDARRFRSDLFYRLGVVTLHLPALRARPEDLQALVESHIAHFAATLRRPVRGIDGDALAALMAYHWPGNVRELINVVERAVLLADAERLTRADFPAEITGGSPAKAADTALAPDLDRPWREARDAMLEAFDEAYFRRVLERAKGSAARAAELAGLPPRTLYDTLKRLGLDRRSYRR